jgi:hypothetical protein
MGVTSVQGFKFKLVADGEILDLFHDEEIKVSNNITGLFDLGVLPSDFTQTITLPGTKKNNHFFEFVYDISVEDPYTFSTNQKVPCYLDFDGIYLSSGYLQLNKVNVLANKFIDSYEITVYGGLASFGRDLKRYFLTDLTSSLAQYNHTASLSNITSSWSGNLFSGSIVYPLAEYGQQITYSPEETHFGIDSPEGALTVEDFKPAIRLKAVWDAIFEEFGFTYTSAFWQQPWLDNVYLVCNNKLRYPIFAEYDLETYGLFKIGPVSGSGQTNIIMNAATPLFLPWYNIQSNPNGNLDSNLNYSISFDSKIRGEINLNFELESLSAGNGVPHFNLIIKTAGTTISTTPLYQINDYMDKIQLYNTPQTKTQTFELLTQWNSQLLAAGTYQFYLEYTNSGGSNFRIILDPNNQPKSYLSVTKVNQGGGGLVMNIADNMPFGTAGIKLIDFVAGVQKKFNLVIQQNKNKLSDFIIEPFKDWYKQGSVVDFNQYINLNSNIEVIPANNLAVQNLNFGDTLDGDYISQQFSKGAAREFGKAYYVDTENFFSQGTFEVKTTLASSPLVYLQGTGTSGSTTLNGAGFQAVAGAVSEGTTPASSYTGISIGTEGIVAASANASPNSTDNQVDPTTGYIFRNVYIGTEILFNATTNANTINTWRFYKDVNGVVTELSNETFSPSGLYTYTVTDTDVASTTLIFSSIVQGESI